MGQRLLWALDRYRGESGALNCPALCRVEGPLHERTLRRALAEVARAHSALRTVFRVDRGLSQVVRPAPAPDDIPLEHLCCEGWPQAMPMVHDALRRRLDPLVSPWAATLITCGANEHCLLINIHHLVTDLVGSTVLIEDLAACLSGTPGIEGGTDTAWDSVRVSQEAHATQGSEAMNAQQRYWYERLAGMQPIRTPLHPRRNDALGSTGLIEGTIDPGTRCRLDAIAERRGTTAFACLLGVLFATAHVQTGQRDLSVATLFSGRTSPSLRRTIAFLVNLLVLRVRLPGEGTYAHCVEQCQRAIAGALQHADLPFQLLSPPPPRMRVHDNARVDDVVFHVVPEPIERTLPAGDCRLRIAVPEVVGRFDLEIAVRPSEDAYIVRITYNRGRLDDVEADRLLRGYLAMSRYVASFPDSPLSRFASPPADSD
ncbi:MAG: condensation domain-containing protein [Pseudomonadota bacterium]